MLQLAFKLIDQGKVPDALIRGGIRTLLGKRLQQENSGGPEAARERFYARLEQMNRSSLAVDTDKANEQHYEVPADFYELVLGPHRKYSSAYYDEGTRTLAEAEERMLELSCQRAGLVDGQAVLELGCGWGSLSLYMARKYPNSKILGISNSNSQRESLMARAVAQGLTNLEIRTCDVNALSLESESFDRVVSVEMFEHVRNHRRLFANIADWLRPGGKLWTHIFVHKTHLYFFEDEGEDDWMSREFFSGGCMPSEDMFLHHQDHLQIERHWRVSGTHYQKTSEAWLKNLDRHRAAVHKIFARTYGEDQAVMRINRWRVFFMACAELWGYKNGEEWLVGHYLFRKR
jgi:cyclopropane-fatty-acyl-phospholipid synthase